MTIQNMDTYNTNWISEWCMCISHASNTFNSICTYTCTWLCVDPDISRCRICVFSNSNCIQWDNHIRESIIWVQATWQMFMTNVHFTMLPIHSTVYMYIIHVHDSALIQIYLDAEYVYFQTQIVFNGITILGRVLFEFKQPDKCPWALRIFPYTMDGRCFLFLTTGIWIPTASLRHSLFLRCHHRRRLRRLLSPGSRDGVRAPVLRCLSQPWAVKKWKVNTERKITINVDNK